MSRCYNRKYEEFVPVAIFLTYCGYVLVDEGEEKIEFKFGEDDKITKFTAVGYCSAAIDEEYVEYLKRIYGKTENILNDIYKTDDVRIKNMIDTIIKEVRQRQKESQRDDDER